MVFFSLCTLIALFNFNLISAQSSDYNGDNEINQLLPGPYPKYKEVPLTSFSCSGKLNWNYYADEETDCQVFHICESEYSKMSFLCPIGSVFNQRHLICDWWYNVPCGNSAGFYPENNNILANEPLFIEASSGGNEPSSLNLAYPSSSTTSRTVVIGKTKRT